MICQFAKLAEDELSACGSGGGHLKTDGGEGAGEGEGEGGRRCGKIIEMKRIKPVNRGVINWVSKANEELMTACTGF